MIIKWMCIVLVLCEQENMKKGIGCSVVIKMTIHERWVIFTTMRDNYMGKDTTYERISL